MGEVGLIEIGGTGALLAIIFGLIEIIRRKYRESTNGDRRRAPTIVNCPNHIEGLAATMTEWQRQSGAQTRVLERLAEDVRHTKQGVDRLVDQHKPDRDGRETWKQSARQERLTEEIRDGIRELIVAVKQNGR